LEARVGVEAVRRFKQSTNSLREKARSEKLEVNSRQCKAGGGCWLPLFAGRRMSGNGKFPAMETQPRAMEEITCDLAFSEKLSGLVWWGTNSPARRRASASEID